MSTEQRPVAMADNRSYKGAPLSRYFFVGMAVFLTAIVFVGFWPTYFGSVFLGQEPTDFEVVEIAWTTHLHAVVFMGWMALLLAQTTFVARGKTRTHMRLGQYGAVYGVFVLLVGLFITTPREIVGACSGHFPLH